MTDGIKILKGGSGTVYVVLHSECKISKEDILKLLAAVGIEATSVVFVEPGDIDEITDLEGASVIFPLDAMVCDAIELDASARHCGQGGANVVVVFGEHFPYNGLHPIAEKYGTQCGWTAESLKEKISGDDSTGPVDGTGSKQKRPSAGQVKC